MRAEEKPRTRPDHGAEFTERQKVSRASDHVTTHTHTPSSCTVNSSDSKTLQSFTLIHREDVKLQENSLEFFFLLFFNNKAFSEKKMEKKLFSTDTGGDAAPRWTVVTQNKEYVEQV